MVVEYHHFRKPPYIFLRDFRGGQMLVCNWTREKPKFFPILGLPNLEPMTRFNYGEHPSGQMLNPYSRQRLTKMIGFIVGQ